MWACGVRVGEITIDWIVKMSTCLHFLQFESGGEMSLLSVPQYTEKTFGQHRSEWLSSLSLTWAECECVLACFTSASPTSAATPPLPHTSFIKMKIAS